MENIAREKVFQAKREYIVLTVPIRAELDKLAPVCFEIFQTSLCTVRRAVASPHAPIVYSATLVPFPALTAPRDGMPLQAAVNFIRA